MTDRITPQEYRDENEFSRYPFADSASLKTSSGALTLPSNVFIDASLYPPGVSERLYISSIEIAARSVVLTFSDADDTSFATASFDPVVPPEVVTVFDTYGRQVGILVSDTEKLGVFTAWPTGIHTFRLGATEFVASVVIPTPGDRLAAFRLDGGDELATGDVWLVGGDGVVVREDEGHIRIDIVGDPLFRRRLCAPFALFETPTFLRTINGCGPDNDGNFRIEIGTHLVERPALRAVNSKRGVIIGTLGKQIDDGPPLMTAGWLPPLD